MDINSTQLNIHIVSWMLVTVRVGTFFYMAPFFGSGSIPVMIKAYTTAILSYIIYKTPEVAQIAEIPNLIILSFYFLKEIAIGIILTTVADFIYLPMQVIGTQVGRSAGIGSAEIFNPDEETQFAVVEQFLYIIAVFLFLLVNGHHLLIKILMYTFQYIPIGEVHLSEKIISITTEFFSDAFSKGVAMATPFIGCILINSLCFGILGKAIPQMNLLVIDLPVRVFVALSGLAFAYPMIAVIYKKFIYYSINNMEKLVYVMSGGKS